MNNININIKININKENNKKTIKVDRERGLWVYRRVVQFSRVTRQRDCDDKLL